MRGPHWRIENDGQVVTNAKIIYVDADGHETDVSNTIQRVEIDLTVGEVSSANIHAIFVDTSRLQTKEAQAVIRRIERKKPPWWRRRLVDVTHFGSKYAEWIKA